MYLPLTIGPSDDELGDRELRAYLKRIGALGAFLSSTDHLSHLQQRHLLSIPYENFDALAGLPARYDDRALFAKMVTSERGGSGAELNLLFTWLLRRLGFTVELRAATVESDHSDARRPSMILPLVEADGVRWLADVGHTIGAVRPLPVSGNAISEERAGRFRVRESEEGGWSVERLNGNRPTLLATVGGALESIETFLRDAPADGGEASPEEALVAIFTEQGRTILAGERLTVIRTDERREAILDAERRERCLEHFFGLDPARLPRR